MTTAKNQTTRRRAKGEGTIFQRNDGRWIGRLTYEDPETGTRKRAQVSGETKTAARKALQALQKRVEDGSAVRDGSGTFGDYAEAWIDSTLAASDRKRSTKVLYGGMTRTHIVGSPLGETRLDKLTAPAVERFIVHLRKKGLGDSSVRQVYTIARAVADAAVRDRLLAQNPFAAVKRPKVTAKEANHLTADEVEALLEAVGESRYRPLFELLLGTALRRGEALALTWGHVNLNDKPKEKPRMPASSLLVRSTLSRLEGDLGTDDPKTARSKRTVPLTPETVEILRRVRARRAEDKLRAGSKWVETEYVFTTEFGDAVDPRNALRALQVAAAKAGLVDVGVHTLRHTAATIMLNNGVPVAVVSRLLGHSSIQVTVDIYGHEDEDASREAVEVLSAKLRSA